MESIRKTVDENLVGTQGKMKIDLGSIDVTLLGHEYALTVTPFARTDTGPALFSPQRKGISSLVWKKTPQGWRVVHEHESYQPS
jgi:ketosteroid isomerase-like protein